LGHSFGGALATKFVYNNPEMIEKMILCDAAVIRKERLNFRQKVAKFMSKVGANIASKTPFYQFFEKIAYKMAGSYDYYRANPIMREIFKKIINDDMSDMAEKIKKPCLVIWGGEDMATPIEDAMILSEIMENSYLKVINSARHNPYRTHQNEVVKLIINFINK
jgi:pimeloyl-ACP methyl ester carboxylesterase